MGSTSQLYTQYDDHEEKDTSIENSLSSLETKATPVIKKIIDSARDDRPPELTSDEKNIWDVFFLIQSFRTPDVLDPIVNKYPDWMSEIIDEYEKEYGPPTEEEIKKVSDPKQIDRAKRNLRATTVTRLTPGSKVFKILQSRGLIIGIVRKPNKSFIIGSNPAAKFYHKLSDLKAEWHLPIAHDITVTHHSSHPREKERIAEITGDHTIRKINEAICKQSSSIAGSSRKLIASLARVKRN